MSPAIAHDRLCRRLIAANSLLFQRGDILADFEAETIREVYSRVVRSRIANPVATPSEMAVIDGAVAAMRIAPRQDLTEAGQAA